MIFENFTEPLDKRWIQTCIGGGTLYYEDFKLRMAFESARQGQYTDAQIDDYGILPRSDFAWRPPLRMKVIARSSLPAETVKNNNENTGTLRGTAGFGFWNYPFSVKGDILALPEAVWFFYASPPSNMALVPGIPGWGWKAQVVHTMQPGSLVATVPLAATIAFGLLTGKTRPAARWMQKVAGASEALLPVEMNEWHNYTLEWQRSEALFWVDDTLVLRSPQ
ncbi:MAG TPA: hypothetical protein VN954_05385, partial [Ktedonobacteraceae bacterium]|nr:hypothetical protein [Ktedonobacteraceae bacterium]